VARQPGSDGKADPGAALGPAVEAGSRTLTSSFLTGVLGFVDIGDEHEWFGFEIGAGGSGQYLEIREIPDAERERWGTGGVHHVAWRVPDDKTEFRMRERSDRARRRPTEVIDRFWFKSGLFSGSRAGFCSRSPPTDRASS